MATKMKRIEPLRRRAEYLRERIERHEGSEGSLGFFQAELAALDWSIEILTDMLEREAADAENVVRQRLFNSWQRSAIKALAFLNRHEPERVEHILEHGPDGIRQLFARDQEQRLYGASIPRADDTRARRY